MRTEFSKNSLGDWVKVFRDNETRPVLCGKVVEFDGWPTWQIWRDIDEPAEYPIFLNANATEQEISAAIEKEIAARPEYAQLF